MMPSPPKRGGIIKSGVSCLTADVPLSRGSPRSHARMRSAPAGRTCAVGPLIWVTIGTDPSVPGSPESFLESPSLLLPVRVFPT